jgi:hypothetical protein
MTSPIKVIVEYPRGKSITEVGQVAQSVRQALGDSEKRGIVSITVRRKKARARR